MSARRCIISVMSRYVIRGPLTYELAQKDSPIRQFFDDRLAAGLKDVQAAYRAAAGPILVPGVPREAADAGTIGTAADWMMRFLVHPTPVTATRRAGSIPVRNAAVVAGTGGHAGVSRQRNRSSSAGQPQALTRSRTCCTGRAGAWHC